MKIIYDNIVFSLQKAGGVSGVWKELIIRAKAIDTMNCQFLEYENLKENLYRKEINIANNSILTKSNKGLFIKKYLNPKITSDSDFIFHSSYYRVCKNKKAKNITTVHDFVYEYYRKGLPKLIHHHQKKHAILASEAIICVSNNTKQDLLNFCPTIKEDQVFVVYNGVSEAYKKIYLNEKPNFIKLLGTYILYVGNRAQPHKNFTPLIYALKQHPEINLVMVGGGMLSKSEVHLFDNILRNRYFHFSDADNEKLNLLYNYAFALVYPSLYEGFGIPIIEAQRAGCPVIAKRGSSITEVAGNSTLLMEYGNSDELNQEINKLKLPNIREDLISKGLINSTRFSWDKMATEVFQVYNSVMK